MEILGIKRLSYGATFAAVVILILLIAGAMFFADKVDGFIDNWNAKTTQAMEMRGSWLGMRLASLDSPTAQRLGIPASAKGVLIAEIEDRNGWRGAKPGPWKAT